MIELNSFVTFRDKAHKVIGFHEDYHSGKLFAVIAGPTGRGVNVDPEDLKPATPEQITELLNRVKEDANEHKAILDRLRTVFNIDV